MKKSLLAVAAIGAFASAAQAQSSVTVYGILDVGYSGGHAKATSGATSANTTGNQFGGGVGAESTNRIGFKGNEDLGGGTSAFFTLESSVTTDGNSILGTSGTGMRQAFVGLGKKGLGKAAVGTQYTPMFTNVSATSPGQLNNVIGDAIYGATNSASYATLSTAQSAATLSGASASGGTDVGFTVRTANMLRFDSDKFAGFGASAFYSLNNDNINQTNNTGATTGYTGGRNDRDGYGLGLDYTWNKLFVAANWQSLKATNPYTQVAPAAATVGAPQIFGSSANTGTNVKDNQWFVGASYDFGILKAYAQYVNRKATSQITATEYGSRTAQQIGVRSFITPTVEAWASAGLGRYQAFGVASPTANFNSYQLGSNYWLSKRSNLYAIYGASNTSSASGNNNTFNAQQYAVGVRHTF
ncbi:MAG: porin [Polynucleobacter sp.]